MSDGTIFAIGAVVFIFGAAGLVLYGLDRFHAWRAREAQPDEPEYLGPQAPGDRGMAGVVERARSPMDPGPVPGRRPGGT